MEAVTRDCQRIFRPDQYGRRRIDAHALQGAKHLGQHIGPLGQRSADARILHLQVFQLGADILDILAQLLLGLGRLDERRGDRGVILAHRGDVGGELCQPLGREADFLRHLFVFAAFRIDFRRFLRGILRRGVAKSARCQQRQRCQQMAGTMRPRLRSQALIHAGATVAAASLTNHQPCLRVSQPGLRPALLVTAEWGENPGEAASSAVILRSDDRGVRQGWWLYGRAVRPA
jgi:hypothetical protein